MAALVTPDIDQPADDGELRGLARSATFRSLSVRNFRLYVSGLLISQAGTWMTRIAQVLLVLSITDNSGTAIGILSAFQYGPILLLGAWAGVITDRSDTRKLLIVVQVLAGLQSLALGLIVAAGAATLPVIFALAAVQGVLTAFDNPARRTLVSELVPPHLIPNAISLNSATITGSRTFGPALAGVVVVTTGYEWCFIIDAVSYLAVVIGLVAIRPSELHSRGRTTRADGQIREGLRYIRNNRQLMTPLIMMTIVCTLAWTFTVSIPLLVTDSLGGSESDFTALFSVLSFGSVIGALLSARRGVVTVRQLELTTWGFGVGMAAMALTPHLIAAYPAALLVGLSSVAFMTAGTTTLQLMAAPEFRGRVTAIQSMVFLGSTPIGSPIVGVAADLTNPRVGVAIGAGACFVAGEYGRRSRRSDRSRPPSAAISQAAHP